MSLQSLFKWPNFPRTAFRAAWVRLQRGLSTAILGLYVSAGQTAEMRETGSHAVAPARHEHPVPFGRLPAGFLTARVLDDASVAGQRAVVTEVRAVVPAPLARAQLAAAWRADPEARVIEQRHGAWHLVSRLSRGTLEVLQIMDDTRHTYGFLTTWRSVPPAEPVEVSTLLPAGFRPGQTVTLNEGARRITGFVTEADRSVKPAVDRLQKHWRSQGLQAVSTPSSSDPLHGGLPSILRFQGRQLELTALLIPQTQPPQFVITVSEPRP